MYSSICTIKITLHYCLCSFDLQYASFDNKMSLTLERLEAWWIRVNKHTSCN